MSCNRELAKRLAEAGIAVFPAGPDKRPLLRWRELSSSDPEAIELMWQRWPDAVPAIDLGKSDLVVLDGDRHGGPDGRTALLELLKRQHGFEGAPIVETPSGGIHVYFDQNGHELTNARGDLPAGVDVRGWGGYVIAPDATMPDGRGYVSGTPHLLAAYQAGAVPHVPEGIVELIRARRDTKGSSSGSSSDRQQQHSGAGIRERCYAEAALDGCARELAAAAPGGRNELANKLAYRMGRMVGAGWIGRSDVEEALLGAMHANGYIRGDEIRSAEATLRSGLDAGMQEPPPNLADQDAGGAGAENAADTDADADEDEAEDEAEEPALGEWDAGSDTAEIPPRGWLLGNTFCRRFISSLLGEGGAGKSALRMAQLLSLATGRALTGEHVFMRCRVLLISLEDDAGELRRRVRAACLHHDIPLQSIQGWLYLAAPGARGGKILSLDRHGRPIKGELAGKIAAVVRDRKIDVVSIDPFVKSHSVEENSNSLIDEVVQTLAELAIDLGVAVDIPHHVAKGAADPGNANRGRGASAMKDGARLVYTLTPMSADEGQLLGLSETDRRRLVRLDSAKVNIAPPTYEAKWFRLVGVDLGNATDLYPGGDQVQTMERWIPPDLFADLGVFTINKILNDIDTGLPDGINRYTDAARTTERSAWLLIQKHYPGKSEAACRRIIKLWMKSGLLVARDYDNPKTRKTVSGLWVDNAKRPG